MSGPFLPDMVCSKCHGRNFQIQAWVENLTGLADPAQEFPWSFYSCAAEKTVQAYFCNDCNDDHGLTEAVPLRDLFPVIAAAAGLVHDAELVAKRKAEWAATRKPFVMSDHCKDCDPGDPCDFHEGLEV